ncbi:MAG: SRPBCC family protein, partial [Halobacteriales archaeon]|nr:SRPBCC family protein [Halobacteriales archaeon]
MARLQFERNVDAPVSVVWDVISDQDLYADAAPNLMAVEILEGEGTGMVRRCVDTDGNAWTETCVAWEENQGFRIAVDVTDSDFHRPLFTRFE